MSKSSFVLKALQIIGHEDVLRLSETLRAKQAPLKKAAGEELIVWEEEETTKEVKKKKTPSSESNVLSFPVQSQLKEIPKSEDTSEKSSEEGVPGLVLTEEHLWQRNLGKSSEAGFQKSEVISKYAKANDMYIVKTPDPLGGKDVTRVASTNGVLVNKKLA